MSARGTVPVAACLVLLAWWSLPAVALPTGGTSEDCSGVCVHGVCDKATDKCKCKRGYEGENCAVPVCSKSPCPPDYDCLMRSFAHNGFICVYNPCAFHPCQSGEICLTDREIPKGYKCTDDPCSSTKCYNGGTCVFDKATETVGCECVPPFSQSSDCFHVLGCHSELRPCQNSGTCTDKFVCECSEGYFGPFCEYLIEP